MTAYTFIAYTTIVVGIIVYTSIVTPTNVYTGFVITIIVATMVVHTTINPNPIGVGDTNTAPIFFLKKSVRQIVGG